MAGGGKRPPNFLRIISLLDMFQSDLSINGVAVKMLTSQRSFKNA
jgi:hypothetical protein